MPAVRCLDNKYLCLASGLLAVSLIALAWCLQGEQLVWIMWLLLPLLRKC